MQIELTEEERQFILETILEGFEYCDEGLHDGNDNLAGAMKVYDQYPETTLYVKLHPEEAAKHRVLVEEALRERYEV